MSRKLVLEPGPAVLDLFAGAGGFSLGFHWAGFQTRVAIDHDPFAVETLDANFGHLGQISLVRDLATLTPRDLRRFLRDSGQTADFDVVVGGPPCQGWSQVGRGKLRALREASGRVTKGFIDPRNKLYIHFLAFVAEFMPAVAIMENVPGMLSHNRNNIAGNVKAAMEQCGYAVTLAMINAADYGVPQIRKRLFFVGVRHDLDVKFSFPPAVTPNGGRLYPEVTVWEAIGDLPPISNGSRDWIRPYHQARKRSPYAARMRMLADPETVVDHVCRRQNDQDLEAFRLMRQGGWYRDLPDRKSVV